MHGLQGAQFCGVAFEETNLAGLSLMLPVKQQEPRGLLA
jgi:hypothetical protein